MQAALKAWVAVLGAVVSVVVGSVAESGLDNVEWINVALLAAGAFNVALTTNVPGYRLAKSIVAGVIAVLTIAADLIATGGEWTHWPQMVVAALTAVGVYATPEKKKPAPAHGLGTA